MSKLSERIAALTGPCREIDAEIERVTTTGYGAIPTPSFTSSLDAITQLIEKGGHMWVLEQGGKNLYSCQVCTNGEYIGWISFHDAPTPAIALCVAFMKVKEANNETDR
ncbi:MAG: hypothetical protein JKY52_08325 [Flavobacteriales bacterium]|nr:hypothetical protein [Flavobacteriales bacterium]